MLGFRFACQRHQEIFVETIQRVGSFNAQQMEDIRRQLLARLSEKFSLLVLDCFNMNGCIGCALDASGVGATEMCGLIDELARASKVPPRDPPMTNKPDDAQLSVLDRHGVWLIHYGLPASVTTVMGSLRTALQRAAELSDEGHSVSLLQTANGAVSIAPEQIMWLWRHLDIIP